MGAAEPEFLAGNHCFCLSLWTAKLCSLQIGGMRFGLGLDAKGTHLAPLREEGHVQFHKTVADDTEQSATIHMGYAPGFHTICNLLLMQVC
jgi:hypothetical protein